MDDATALPAKIFNVIELADYTIDFQIIQNPNQNWTYCLQIFPSPYSPESLDENEYVPELGYVKKIKEVDAGLLYGREYYTQWEYAAETAMDIIELLGFRVTDEVHYFDICFWNNDTHERVIKKGMSDSLEFKLVPATQ